MKLLFDANLSPKLVSRLIELFPGSIHVFNTGMEKFTPDEDVWAYAGTNGFTIVTADADFIGLLEKWGAPPKIIRLEQCDYKTRTVEDVLRHNAIRIQEFEQGTRALLRIDRPAKYSYMPNKIARRWFISGIVQGVGFRYFVEANANALGLSGWARNLDDGRVEVYAVGPESALNDLAAALHTGPRMAQVRGVEQREDHVQSLSGFTTR